MLEDPAFQPVVSWGPHGDCFVVKDMNEFTKSILPRMFKHSNFASFVRQLNKYDFHKVSFVCISPSFAPVIFLFFPLTIVHAHSSAFVCSAIPHACHIADTLHGRLRL